MSACNSAVARISAAGPALQQLLCHQGRCAEVVVSLCAWQVFVRRQAVPGGLPSRYSTVLNPNRPPQARYVYPTLAHSPVSNSRS